MAFFQYRARTDLFLIGKNDSYEKSNSYWIPRRIKDFLSLYSQNQIPFPISNPITIGKSRNQDPYLKKNERKGK